MFANGQALFEVVCEHELEGVVAKRLDGRYRPGERDWVKTKNRAYWRWELEREGAILVGRGRSRPSTSSGRAGVRRLRLDVKLATPEVPAFPSSHRHVR